MKRYCVIDMDIIEKLAFVRTEAAWKIVSKLAEFKAFSISEAMPSSELASHLKLSRQNCHKQCKRLEEYGLLKKARIHRINLWYLDGLFNISKFGFNPEAFYNH